jgi:hypothetical protein
MRLPGDTPSYDVVLAEHGPEVPGGESCRKCGFFYTDHPACPAVILAQAGFADLTDRIRVVPQTDPDHRALCELTVTVERMAARLDVIGAHILLTAPARQPRHQARPRRILRLPTRRRAAVIR